MKLFPKKYKIYIMKFSFKNIRFILTELWKLLPKKYKIFIDRIMEITSQKI